MLGYCAGFSHPIAFDTIQLFIPTGQVFILDHHFMPFIYFHSARSEKDETGD